MSLINHPLWFPLRGLGFIPNFPAEHQQVFQCTRFFCLATKVTVHQLQRDFPEARFAVGIVLKEYAQKGLKPVVRD